MSSWVVAGIGGSLLHRLRLSKGVRARVNVTLAPTCAPQRGASSFSPWLPPQKNSIRLRFRSSLPVEVASTGSMALSKDYRHRSSLVFWIRLDPKGWRSPHRHKSYRESISAQTSDPLLRAVSQRRTLGCFADNCVDWNACLALHRNLGV